MGTIVGLQDGDQEVGVRFFVCLVQQFLALYKCGGKSTFLYSLD